ncbi:nicotianamine synthase [Penicillium sp. DV-2018c]|nr:nicotianamine synthase [Penicillium sp. DV-2018c]
MARPETSQVEDVILELLELIEKLSTFSSLSPSPELDVVLGRISHICHQTQVSGAEEDEILNDPRVVQSIPTLRTLWAEAAGALEDDWARKILTAKDADEAKTLLATYPRIQNYKTTIPIELGVISIVLQRFPKKVAMLGSGPLPLTSLSIKNHAIEKNHALDVLNVDIVPERIAASKQIFKLLGSEYGSISHFVSDASGTSLPDLKDSDAVYLASLIGVSNEDKVDVIANVARGMSKDSVIVIRSSSGLSRLLWPNLEMKDFARIRDLVEPALAAQPLSGPTKHSVVVLRVVG